VSGSSPTGDRNRAAFGQLAHAVLRSETNPNVSYRMEKIIGRGGFAVACLATREGIGDPCSVVLKITQPSVISQSGEMVGRLFKKEVVALGRLNERVPPTPFVVRLLDTGVVEIQEEGRPVPLPWLAVEYVHGGVEGETLQKRVKYSIEHTGSAFTPDRAAMMLKQLTLGLSEIHAASVIHRDLKPSNVLTCGFGQSEMVKISDFGIARPSGMTSTFGKLALGTAGYVAPEQVHMRDDPGPWTDVFSLGGIVFFMLTGEKLFDVPSPVEAVLAAVAKERRSLLDAKALCPELRAHVEAVKEIDRALARATAADPKARFESADGLSRAILPWLSEGIPSTRASDRLVSSVVTGSSSYRRDPSSWQWTCRRAPGSDIVLTSLAWESDGHCLAATQTGLRYWDGTSWAELARSPIYPIHMVRRLGAGRFVLSGDGGRLYEYVHGDAVELVRTRDARSVVTELEGTLDDLAVMVAHGSPPSLLTLCGRHWLKPLVVEEAASIAGLARLDRERWLVVGRKRDGGALALVFHPLDWRLEPLAAPPGPALVNVAAQPELGIALAVGGDDVLRISPAQAQVGEISGAPSLSTAAIDVLAGAWAGGPGRIWFAPDERSAFFPVWEDPTWDAPFVGLFADVDHVVAITVDGGVLEGEPRV
jgi:serine/threonine protein kinase